MIRNRRRASARHVIALGSALAVLTTLAATGGPRMVEADASLPVPLRRFAPCGALDVEGGRLAVFGGRSEAASTHFSDAWTLDLDGARERWTQVATSDTPGAPPPTRSCAAAWDHHADRLLVFGGWNGTTMRNGVWSLDPDVGTWQQLCDATSCGPAPTPRRAAAAAYDPVRDRLIVMGGLDGTFRNDVWALSLHGAPQWSPVSTSGTAPTPRASHTMTYDAGRDRVWIVGGTTSGSDLGDVWALALDDATWSELEPPGCPAGCPAPRSGHVVGFDTALDRLVLYGGLLSATGVAPRDPWALDVLDGDGEWTRIDPASAVPQPRFVPVGGFDPVGRRLVVFGGGLGASAYRDTLALHLPLDGSAAWRSIAPVTPFTARDQAAAVLGAKGTITLFGGFGSGTFPGTVDAGSHLADTWQLPLRAGARRAWRDATPTEAATVPVAREAMAVAHDVDRRRTYLVGGLNGDVSLNDVWVMRPGNGSSRWSQLCSPTSCGEAPEPRWGAHAVWDPDGRRVVLFGGRRSDGSSLSDTWVLETNGPPRWDRVDTGDLRPPARWGGAATYDPTHRRLVVFGGQAGPDANATRFADTWALSLDGAHAWDQLEPAGGGPSGRRSPAYATRRTRRAVELLVAGGLSDEAHHDDVWRLSLDSVEGRWEQLSPDRCGEPDAPPCRRSASAVWDGREDRLVMLLGRDGERFFDDVWELDLPTCQWQRVPVAAPAS